MTARPRMDDPAEFGRVAVLLGGTSSEREVSLDSGRNVLAALQRRGVDATAVDGIPALVAALTAPGGRQFDRVFNILHGNRGGGEDGVLQGLLEALGVPYTGSGVLGSSLSMDKIRTKQVWLSVGLPTPAYVTLQRGEDVVAAAHKLGLPVIVKPACEGSSVGITRCFRDADLAEAVALAARYEGALLVEQLVQGEEYTVARARRGGAAFDPHRARRRVLRLPRQVRRRGHAVPVPGPGRCGRAGTRDAGARGLLRRGLQRLGPRGLHARPRGQALAARGQHGARHDQPLARAEGGAPAGHRVRRTRLARARDELQRTFAAGGPARVNLPFFSKRPRRQATRTEPHWYERLDWHAIGTTAAVVASFAVVALLLIFALDRPVRRVLLEGPFQRVAPPRSRARSRSRPAAGSRRSTSTASAADVEAIAWVDNAVVTRVWPDAIKVRRQRAGRRGPLERHGPAQRTR